MQTTIIYPGTFDPITKGHTDLIQRALRLFDKVIVAVAKDTHKKTLFSYNQRIELITAVLAKYSNVEVLPFSGLLVDFAKQRGVKAILRGLRAVSDFEYEFQLAGMNRHLNADIETIFLTPSEKFTCVSSTLIKEAATLGGDVSAFVEPIIVKALSEL
jgi:pantetheine-phosphate adenylyltransferase